MFEQVREWTETDIKKNYSALFSDVTMVFCAKILKGIELASRTLL